MKFADAAVVWPDVAEVAAPFYQGMQQHKVMIQRCESCQTYLPPAQVVCDHCGGNNLTWQEAKGNGKVYSFVVYHRSFHPSFDDKLPYTVALIELTEGPRLQALLVGEGVAQCRVGMPVKPAFIKISDEHTLLCFDIAEK